MTLSQLAAATPATRERFADAVRAFSIATVVLGHWMAVTRVRNDLRRITR